MGLIFRAAEVDGHCSDVRVADGRIAEIAPELSASGEDIEIYADGSALVTGLHDEHLHTFAYAAAQESIDVGPNTVVGVDGFINAVRAALPHGSVRGVGYLESAGNLVDRVTLDAISESVPIRIQHSTGGLWILNTAALEQIAQIAPGRLLDERFERDASGALTGRIWRADDLVRIDSPAPDLARLGRELAEYGVTAITDATPTNDAVTIAAFRQIPQHCSVMSSLDLELAAPNSDRLRIGAVKVLLDDDTLPSLDAFVTTIRAAHARGRSVAVHCVTLVQIRFAIAGFRISGTHRDRIEHASVAPPDAIADLRELGLTVVTQPGFVATRGDDYLRTVDERDVPNLYPLRSLLAAGVSARGSSDAPYGPLDPWLAMNAAVTRRTKRGATLNVGQGIEAAAALRLYGVRTRLRVGDRSDLVLLDAPITGVLRRLSRERVVVTVINGTVVHDAR